MYDNDYLLISGLQHFVFCRRQWALIHIERQWQENFLTAEGRVVHSRVHDVGVKDFRNGTLTIRGLNVKSDKLGLTGTAYKCKGRDFGDCRQKRGQHQNLSSRQQL